MLITRKPVFVSDDQDQIGCLNFHLNMQGIRTDFDGRVIFSSKYNYKNCLFKGAIFADDMNLTDVKWIAKSGYVQHNMKGVANAARTSLDQNSLSNQILKQLYSNPFQTNTLTQPTDPEPEQ